MSRYLLVLTGERGSGKTTLLQRLIKHKAVQGWKIGGLLTPARVEAGVKTGFYAVDLQSGESHLFASRNPDEIHGFPFCEWTFDPAVLVWGNQVLAGSESVDLLIIDEIGPLELEHGEGWKNAIAILEKGTTPSQIILTVIRPECLMNAVKRFSPYQIIYIGEDLDQTLNQLCELVDNLKSQ